MHHVRIGERNDGWVNCRNTMDNDNDVNNLNADKELTRWKDTQGEDADIETVRVVQLRNKKTGDIICVGVHKVE